VYEYVGALTSHNPMGLHTPLQGEFYLFRDKFVIRQRIPSASDPILELVHEIGLIPSPKIDPLLFLGLKCGPDLLFLGWNETVSN
jgi:hypothetical protein